jgi:16S rRNA (uracil1498-N3)-methyltransferase
MAIRDLTSERLFLAADLASGARIPLEAEQASYLRRVLRLDAGARVLVFNGRDGEWAAHLEPVGKRDAVLRLAEPTRPQESGPDLWYLFAPLKRARLDYMVQKAVELGVARLSPVMTRRTNAERVSLERMRANAIEAAEQCGILWLPEIDAAAPLATVLGRWPEERALVVADEEAPVADPLAALGALHPGRPMAVLIGPEGGFDAAERAILRSHPAVTTISLGPRIMRADTAAVAALALVDAVLGDWR